MSTCVFVCIFVPEYESFFINARAFLLYIQVFFNMKAAKWNLQEINFIPNNYGSDIID